MRRALHLLLAAGPVCLAAACPAGIEAITWPSEDVTLAFTMPGRVAEVLVKEHEAVTKGQLLIRLDDEAERVQLAQLRSQSEDTTRIRAAEAQLEQYKVTLRKIEDAFEKRAATEFERDKARLDVTIGELSLELAKFQHSQEALQYEEARIRVERMRLVSPIDGYVAKIQVKPGSSADAQEKILRVIKINPLRIEVPVPLGQARPIRPGDPARVKFSGTDAKTVDTKVTSVAPLADPASDTLTVVVEVPNPTGRQAGEHVEVSFPAPAGGSDRGNPGSSKE